MKAEHPPRYDENATLIFYTRRMLTEKIVALLSRRDKTFRDRLASLDFYELEQFYAVCLGA